MNKTSPLLRVEDLTVSFRSGSGWKPVIEGVSFEIERGEIMGLVGESGSGKSITSLAIMGLLPKGLARIDSGRVLFGDRDLTSLPDRELRKLRGARLGMVFQEPLTSLNPVFTIGQQITAALRQHTGMGRAEARTRAADLLERVGIPEPGRRLSAYPFQLSGGMRQRALIALAISCSPELLIADEPTTALDVTIQAQILDLLRDLRRDMGLSILFITHDLAVIAELCDTVAVFYAGEVQEKGPAGTLFRAPAHPYSQGLLGCIPDGRHSGELKVIPGMPPPRIDVIPGCRFAPRCEHATEICRTRHPELERRPQAGDVRCLRWKEIAA